MCTDDNSIVWISRRAEIISALRLPVDASDTEIVSALVRDEEKYRAAMIGLQIVETVVKGDPPSLG
jgi:hypothetical protein